MRKLFTRIINRSIGTLVGWRTQLTKPAKDSPEYIQAQRVEKWFGDDGDNTLRLNYELDEKSIVFDVGGYKGEFAGSMINKYNCTVFVFEPIPEFYNIIVNKF